MSDQVSAIELDRHDAHTGSAFWRDRERLAALARHIARRHGLPAGLALVVGAVLRLLWLGDTSFLGDQAQLLSLGRSAADQRAFILTGIPSSIGSLNLPASTWLYAPFALLGGPLGATILTALANILAIALLYAIAARYLSRRAGFAAALLYATASGPIHYARFIWQQNLLAPVVLLLFWTILLAVVERRRGWLGWSVLLWGMATALHPTAAPLLGLIIVALAFTWRDLRRRDLAWAAAALVALFGPTLLWEALSHGYDLVGAQHFSQGHTVFDTWALTYLLQLMQPAAAQAYGASSAYVAVGRGVVPLGAIVAALLIAAQVWLVASLAAPWLKRTGAGWVAPARVALADAHWRVALLLGLWEALPLAFMLRHSRPVEPHYLLVLLPAVYLTIGAALTWASVWLPRTQALRLLPQMQTRRLGLIALVALVTLVGSVSVTQTIGVVGELATIHSGKFDALTLPLHYGTPLSSEQAALAALQTLARERRANVAIAATRVQQEPLGYLNATNSTSRAATDYISEGCLALPAASAQAPLVTLAVPGSTAAQSLPHIQGARPIGSIEVQGGSPYLLYAIAPGASGIGETAIATPASAGAPQPAAYTYAPAISATLTIRWVGAPTLQTNASSTVSYWYGADPRTAPIADYIFSAQPLNAQGQPIGAPLTAVCARLAWSRQLSIVTSMPVPAALATGGQLASWRVWAQMAPAEAIRPTLGPLALETGAITFGPPRPLGPPVTFAVP
jgi:hypothetical protein